MSAKPATMPPVTVTWPAAAEAVTVQVTCPNCGNNRPKALRLSMMFETPGHPQRHSRLLNCPACGCSFYERQLPPDYQDPEFLTKGRVPFYLQQGAGLSLITRPLARCRSGAGAAYLEVGCGFGFGVDYALHAKQWVARGIDPGEISVLGAELLKLSIDVRYLSDEETALRQSFDVVMASETIEHVPSPERFVSTLRNVLRPGGMLILTTPDAADLNEHTIQSSLIGLLSPGLHLIFQTANSLRDLLLSRGFRHVAIEKDGHSLVAFASDTAFALQDDEGRVREEYRTYLERRSEDPSLGRDLFFAFAGRAMQESVNDGCFDQARRVRQQIGFACVKHFGRDLQELGVQAQLLAESDLEQLSRKVPLNLGGLLYADAMLQLADGTSRRDMMEAFDQAAFAAETLIRAVGELAMGDALSAAIAWQAQAEAALCAAAVGHASIMHRLQTLETRGQVGSLQSSEITLRAFVGLVNGEHYELAHQLLETLSPNALDWADPDSSKMLSPVERDAAYCLSVLEVQGSNPITLDVSRRRFARLKTLLEWHDNLRTPGLYEGVLRGEQLAAEKLSAEGQASDPQSPAPRSPVAESALRALPSDGPKLPILAKCGPVTLCIEQLWREGGGLYVSGWVVAGAEPIGDIKIRTQRGHIISQRKARHDLTNHYPLIPDNGAQAGFSAYVPSRTDTDMLHLEVHASGCWNAAKIQLTRGVEIEPLQDHKERTEANQAFESFITYANRPGRHVLEIGSRVVGATSVGMRAHFPRAARFVGLDIHPSIDVDVVGDAHKLSRLVGASSFDAIFSIATLEHLAMPWMVALEINRTLRVGGLTYHVAPHAWPIHETPNDFWRFTDEGLKVLFGPANNFEVIAAGLAERIKLYPHDLAPTHLQMPFAPAYASAYIVARKLADIDVEAPSDQSLEIQSQLYPRQP